MSDSCLPIPPSFMALHMRTGQRRPDHSAEHIATRHEFCDDLAQLMSNTARQVQWDLGLDEGTVLDRMLQGLQAAEEPVVSAMEARWVVCRLAELLGWPMPEDAASFGHRPDLA